MGVSAAQGSAGLKPGVCTSTTRPSNPFEGQMIYETDTDLTYIYGGTAWQQVSGGTAVGNSGLVYVTSATIGTGVSSVVLTNCFNSTYENYRLVVNITSNSSSNSSLTLRMRDSGGTDSTSNYFFGFIYAIPSTGAVSSAGNTSGSYYDYAVNCLGTSGGGASIDILKPFLAQVTVFTGGSPRGDLVGSTSGYHNVGSSYVSLSLTSGGGTVTGGTVAVYGYRKA